MAWFLIAFVIAGGPTVEFRQPTMEQIVLGSVPSYPTERKCRDAMKTEAWRFNPEFIKEGRSIAAMCVPGMVITSHPGKGDK